VPATGRRTARALASPGRGHALLARCSDLGEPAVDGQFGAVDEAGFGGGEEQDRGSDFLAGAELAGWDHRRDSGAELGGDAVEGGGFDRSR
jgi:hypothetical protein